jgi:hypothetical protein
MQDPTTHRRPLGRTLLPIAALLVSSAGCGWVNNTSSEINCAAYCSKDYDCDNVEPSSDDTDACVNSCRDSIEDNCGNDYQAEANAQIADCVDLACSEFRTCMVFEAAPACFEFVDN